MILKLCSDLGKRVGVSEGIRTPDLLHAMNDRQVPVRAVQRLNSVHAG
jgi:hypothetical protein